MDRNIKNSMKKKLALLMTLCVAGSLLFPFSALAAAPVGYMPGVTEEMTEPSFWYGQTVDPDALLATAEDIARINQAAIDGAGTNRWDMKNLKETYNGITKRESLQKSTAEDVKYYLAVNRTELLTFPWDGQILDDPVDYDFDYQPLVGIRVNEPVAIYSTSADGKYFQVSTSCCTGWVRTEDIAICKDKEEWLSAWDIPAEKRLVFWGDKMYTDYSKTALQTVCRLITMGTVLERMDEGDPDALVINRLPLHNYAVYLPVRNEDGSYGKTPALINARERVSEDYLPLTARNLATVALTSLGDAYGWGAGLNNEDCTSLNHSIFCCFGRPGYAAEWHLAAAGGKHAENHNRQLYAGGKGSVAGRAAHGRAAQFPRPSDDVSGKASGAVLRGQYGQQPDEPLQRKTSADPLLPDQYIGHQTRKRKNLDV